MSYDLFLPLLTFAFAAAITPGPNNVMLMASGANFGFRRTLPHMAGITIGFSVMIILAGAGLMTLFDLLPWLRKALAVVCFLFLLFLAWKVANARRPNEATASGKPLTFLQAAGFQWVNPKAWTMGTSAITLYAAGGELWAVTVVSLAFLLGGMVAVVSWTLIGQQISQFLSSTTRLRVFNITMAVLLVVSVLPAFFLQL